jgi:hypothetical protein
MAGFLVYKETTGIILRIGTCPSGMEAAQAQPGELMLLNPTAEVSVETHIVIFGLPPTIELKPNMTVSSNKTFIKANGVDSATISNIPVGSYLYIDGIYSQQVDDGLVVFKSQEIGPTALQFINEYYQEFDLTINVGCVVSTLILNTEVVMPPGITSMLDLSSEIIFVTSNYRALTGTLLVNDELPLASSNYLALISSMLLAESEMTFSTVFGSTVGDESYISVVSDLLIESEQPL